MNEIGCVEVVGCVTREELAGWEMVPEGVGTQLLSWLSYFIS